MTKSRIYTVANGDQESLVRATSESQAIRHVVKGMYVARVATQDDIALLVGAGVKIQDARAPSGQTDPKIDDPTLDDEPDQEDNVVS